MRAVSAGRVTCAPPDASAATPKTVSPSRTVTVPVGASAPAGTPAKPISTIAGLAPNRTGEAEAVTAPGSSETSRVVVALDASVVAVAGSVTVIG